MEGLKKPKRYKYLEYKQKQSDKQLFGDGYSQRWRPRLQQRLQGMKEGVWIVEGEFGAIAVYEAEGQAVALGIEAYKINEVRFHKGPYGHNRA